MSRICPENRTCNACNCPANQSANRGPFASDRASDEVVPSEHGTGHLSLPISHVFRREGARRILCHGVRDAQTSFRLGSPWVSFCRSRAETSGVKVRGRACELPWNSTPQLFGKGSWHLAQCLGSGRVTPLRVYTSSSFHNSTKIYFGKEGGTSPRVVRTPFPPSIHHMNGPPFSRLSNSRSV